MAERICKIDGCGKNLYAKGLCNLHYKRMKKHGDPLLGRAFSGSHIKFLKGAITSDTSECIEWPYGKGDHGYGVTLSEGKLVGAHRLVLQMYSGCDGQGLYACHAPEYCHNRLCVNPKHLRWATPKENSFDKIADKSLCHGSSRYNAKLNEEKVKEILLDTRSHRDIAEEYGVSRSIISRVKSRKIWKHLEIGAS